MTTHFEISKAEGAISARCFDVFENACDISSSVPDGFFQNRIFCTFGASGQTKVWAGYKPQPQVSDAGMGFGLNGFALPTPHLMERRA